MTSKFFALRASSSKKSLARTCSGRRFWSRRKMWKWWIHSIPEWWCPLVLNAGAESGSNRLFATKTPQCWFLEKLCLLSTMSGMEMDVSHIAGPINIEADGLSRWNGTDSPPHHFRASDYIRISLSNLWIQSVVPRTFPSDVYLLWRLPGSDSWLPELAGI